VEGKTHRRVLKEIVDGYSAYYVGDKKRYVKHQSLSDVVDFELVYDNHYERAKKRGLPPEEEILAQLEKDEIWSQKDEIEIEKQTFYLESLRKNKTNLYLKSAISQMNKQIKEGEEKLEKMIEEKNSLTSNSCENYALNRANDFYMFSSFFKDTEMREPLYTQEEFENIDASAITHLVRTYNEFHSKFSETSIQALVLQDFYKIYYSFSESCADFFGMPIVRLTNFQLNLIIYTRVFKNIFEQHDDIPDKIKKDPAALLDFANSSGAREEVRKKMTTDDKGASSIVGATSEDLAELGLENSQSKSIQKAAEEKGGSLSMKDLMDLSGV